MRSSGDNARILLCGPYNDVQGNQETHYQETHYHYHNHYHSYNHTGKRSLSIMCTKYLRVVKDQSSSSTRINGLWLVVGMALGTALTLSIQKVIR